MSLERSNQHWIWYYLSVTKASLSSAITRGLKTCFIGREIIFYPSLPSTMDAAREAARRGAANGTVIIAGEQTQGRGRLKRTWLSPEGNIALSIILYPDIVFLPYLIMIASLAVSQSIETVTGIKTQIKWPNDVLIDGKKVCGFLIENEIKKDRVGYSLIGIGINVNLNVAAFPQIAATAVSLDNARGNDRRVEIIRALLTEFEKFYIKLPDGKAIFNEWRDRLVTLGKKVRATAGEKVIEGLAEAVDESGALMIRQSNRRLVKVVAGDVTLW